MISGVHLQTPLLPTTQQTSSTPMWSLPLKALSAMLICLCQYYQAIARNHHCAIPRVQRKPQQGLLVVYISYYSDRPRQYSQMLKGNKTDKQFSCITTFTFILACVMCDMFCLNYTFNCLHWCYITCVAMLQNPPKAKNKENLPKTTSMLLHILNIRFIITDYDFSP